MKDDLRKWSIFQIDVGINKPENLGEFLERSQRYMNFVEDDLACREAAEAEGKKGEPGNLAQKESPGGSIVILRPSTRQEPRSSLTVPTQSSRM